MNKKVEKAFNDQIQLELSSAYLYLAMAAHFEGQNLPGFAHWMKAQFQEEQGHAMRLYEHVNDRGGRVVLEAIEKPPTEFGSPREVFEAVLKHERKVTASIHKLYELAGKENDLAAQVHLQWFINEQVEEEKNAIDILAQLTAVEEHKHALLMVDHHLGQRGS